MSENKATKTLLAPEFDLLNASLQCAIKTIPDDDCYIIALSGGLDSMALLYFVLPYLKNKTSLKNQNADVSVLHVHHGLSQFADEWTDHCQRACGFFGVDCNVEHVVVTQTGEGPESAARTARYQVFESYLSQGGTLLQGHHQNDQAETVIMRMLRGAGPEGLAGIPLRRKLASGQIYRPWLNIPRSLLQQEAEKFNVAWVEDDSNADPRFDRNFIRHQILPLIEQRWPSAVNSIVRTSDRAAQAHKQISDWSKAALGELISQRYCQEQALMLAGLHDYSEYEQRLLVRHWLEQLGLEQPSEVIFNRIWNEMIPAKASAQPELCWGQHRLRRYEDCLFYLSPSDVSVGDESVEYRYEISFSNETFPVECDAGSKTFRFDCLPSGAPIPQNTLLLRLPKADERVIIKSRTGGESFCLQGSSHSKTLKKILQEQHIPPWQRQSLPLVYYGETLVFVGCGLVAEGYGLVDGEDFLAISCR